MATGQLSRVIEHLRQDVLLRENAELTDGQLLDCFIRQREEAAIATLVRRHGPMVWAVCRRILRNHQDAEDAFQATYLLLIRKAASVVPREMVANWLHGVAYQTARKAQQLAAKRNTRERQVPAMPEPEARQQEIWHDLQPVLDEELDRLANKYRMVILLCDLEGKTRKEAARQLRLPEGTVAGRLARARTMLARRLRQRGVTLSGGALATLLSQQAASASVPATVASATIKVTTLFAGADGATTVVAPKVAGLMKGVLSVMLLNKLKSVSTVLLMVGLLIIGGGLVSQQMATGNDGPGKGTAEPITVNASRKKEPQQTDKQKMQGLWKVVQLDTVRRDRCESCYPNNMTWTIDGNKIVMSNGFGFDDPAGGLQKGTYQLGGDADDPAQVPSAINVTLPFTAPPDGRTKTFRGVFAWKGDKLLLCFRTAPGPRPKSVGKFPENLFIVVLERLQEKKGPRKDNQAAATEGPATKVEQAQKQIKPIGTTITGRVVSEPGGKEVAGVPVTLWNGEGGERRTARTDDKGLYSFANVKPGDYYKVWIEERPKMEAGFWSEAVVVRVQDRPVRADDLFRRLPQSISGTVTDADSGKPVAGANMHFSTADGNWAAVGTDSEGRYYLFVTPRDVELSCHGTEERYYPSGPREKVTVAAGKNLTGIDFKVKSAPQFSGVVVFPDGKPAKGLKVRVEIHWLSDSGPTGGDIDSGGIGRDLRFQTDDAGHFHGHLRRPLRQREKETVELKAIARLADGTMGGVGHGKTSSKEEYRVTPLKVVLGKSSGVKVRIVNRDGKAIADAKLTASNIQAGWNIDLGGPAKHLGDGRYLMTNLIPGLDYHLAIQAPGYQTGAPAKALILKADEIRDIGEIRLERVRQKPKTDAAVLPPLDDPWFAAVAAMPAEKQVKAVADKLKERNPGYDGTIWGHKIDGKGVVTEFGFYSKDVKDLSPVRALPALQMLRCGGSGETGQLSDLSILKGQKLTRLDCALTSVSDLSPLKDMKLTFLYCFHTKVTDLSPLKGMPLTTLNFWSTSVSDLSPLKDAPLENLNLAWTPVADLAPLKGMRLTTLNCDSTKVSDLAPLKGMPLKDLRFGSTQVSDLTPLQGMPLTFLSCGSTKVSDLSPLKGMPLEELYIRNTKVSDLSPLKGMPLKVLHCDFTVGRDDDILRSIKSLTEINGKPVEEFWKELGFQGN